MARRRGKARTPTATPQAAGEAALAPHSAQARASELLKERERLLREIQKKQRQLEQVKRRASEAADQAVSRMAPLIQRQRELSNELAALFEQLLGKERLSARARSQLLRLRRSLELQGLLDPSLEPDDQEPDDAETEHDHEYRHHRADGDAGPSARPRAERGPEVAGASQAGQQRRSLRDIFRSLARAVHPDQARREDDRERRTEVMKQVTRAYEDGDLARLIELEGAWQREQALTESGDPEQRCAELTRLNRELLNQLREVTRQLRDAKRDLADAEDSSPSDELVELANLELDDVEGMCELLRRFRDGKISISDLTHGPIPRPRRRRSATSRAPV